MGDTYPTTYQHSYKENKAMVEITANKSVDGDERSATIATDLGDSLQDAVAKFGEEVIFSNYKRAVTITAQAAMRRMLEQNLDQDTITNKMASWKPGVALDRSVDPVAALKAKMATMSKAEKKALLEELGL